MNTQGRRRWGGSASRVPTWFLLPRPGSPEVSTADTDSPSASTFFAAFTYAFSSYPQVVHRNTAWLSRLSGSTVRHAEQRCDVYAAGTFTIVVPVHRATFSRASWSLSALAEDAAV